MKKLPDERVSIANHEADFRITARLNEIMPGVPVIGEEAVSARPSRMHALRREPVCWLVDPLDSTANFVAGRPEFAVMVALLRASVTIRSWIWQPVGRVGYIAAKDSGAWRDGERL